MKSEERHKLHQNALADWLANVFTTVKPYQNAILGGVIVVILAAITTMWWTNQSAAKGEKAWTGLFSALNNNSPSELTKVAEDNRRSPASTMALLIVADVQLAQGCNLLFINKAAANQELNKALDVYQAVLNQTKAETLRAQATFGLARVLEAAGRLDLAERQYQQVTTSWPNTTFARMAAQRLQDLQRLSTKQMYDRFAQFDPKPAFSQQPGQQPGQQQPGQPQPDLDKIPEESPIATPEAPAEQKPEEKNEAAPEAKPEQTSPEKSADKPAQ